LMLLTVSSGKLEALLTVLRITLPTKTWKERMKLPTNSMTSGISVILISTATRVRPHATLDLSDSFRLRMKKRKNLSKLKRKRSSVKLTKWLTSSTRTTNRSKILTRHQRAKKK